MSKDLKIGTPVVRPEEEVSSHHIPDGQLKKLLGQMVALKQQQVQLEQSLEQTNSAILRTDGAIALVREVYGQTLFNETVEVFNAEASARSSNPNA